jgi:hypothetical protein
MLHTQSDKTAVGNFGELGRAGIDETGESAVGGLRPFGAIVAARRVGKRPDESQRSKKINSS